MADDTPKRMIIVMSCGHGPISRLMKIKDGPFCGHQATDGMEVGDYSDSIHPDCPLREVGEDAS